MELVKSWTLVMMFWGGPAGGREIEQAPGYQSEADCNVAAAHFNDGAPMVDERAAICIPGPVFVKTPIEKPRPRRFVPK